MLKIEEEKLSFVVGSGRKDATFVVPTKNSKKKKSFNEVVGKMGHLLY